MVLQPQIALWEYVNDAVWQGIWRHSPVEQSMMEDTVSLIILSDNHTMGGRSVEMLVDIYISFLVLNFYRAQAIHFATIGHLSAAILHTIE